MSELVYLYMHNYKADDYVKNNIILDTKYWYVCIFLSLGLASEVPKLTHYWVVLFHPRASAKVTSRLCPFIGLGAT